MKYKDIENKIFEAGETPPESTLDAAKGEMKRGGRRRQRLAAWKVALIAASCVIVVALIGGMTPAMIIKANSADPMRTVSIEEMETVDVADIRVVADEAGITLLPGAAAGQATEGKAYYFEGELKFLYGKMAVRGTILEALIKIGTEPRKSYELQYEFDREGSDGYVTIGGRSVNYLAAEDGIWARFYDGNAFYMLRMEAGADWEGVVEEFAGVC